MAVSGIGIDPEVKSIYDKATRHGSKFRYAIFGLNDKKTFIVSDKLVERTDDDKWEDFCNEFEDTECKLAIYNVPVITSNNQPNEDVLILSWNGPSAKVNKKMTHASTVQGFKATLGKSKMIEIDGREELQNIQEILNDKFSGSKYAGK